MAGQAAHKIMRQVRFVSAAIHFGGSPLLICFAFALAVLCFACSMFSAGIYKIFAAQPLEYSHRLVI